MKFVIALCLVGAVIAYPRDALYGPPPPGYTGNPDEWGPHFQGDIVLKKDKNGMTDTTKYWPGGNVPYEFAANVDEANREIIRGAYAEYTQVTDNCVTFQELSAGHSVTNFVKVKQAISVLDNGCHSYVGMIGGEQDINYPQWCINQYGSILHEMTHALGFWHMQSAAERDAFVIIHEENIQPAAIGNFDIQTDSSMFGEQYDYDSVMHYSKSAFAINNGDITIETKNPAYQDEIGQRERLSLIDIAKVKAMYCP